jgi:hypothetical protein
MARRSLFLAAALVFGSGDWARANDGGFVYLAVPVLACAQAPCAPPRIDVYDADTLGLVAAIPLPVQTTTVGMAMSFDGRHLYVSNRRLEMDGQVFGQTSLTVIDARRHAVAATYAVPVFGELAVRGDDSVVYILSPNNNFSFTISAVDTVSRTIAASRTVSGGADALGFNKQLDRLYFQGPSGTVGLAALIAYDAATLSEAGRRPLLAGRTNGMAVTPDGAQVWVDETPTQPPSFPRTNGTRVAISDATTLAELPSRSHPGSFSGPVSVARTGEMLFIGMTGNASQASLLRMPVQAGPVTLISIPSVGRLVVPGPERAALVDVDGETGDTLLRIDLSTNAASQARLPIRATLMTGTPRGAASCNYQLSSRYSSWTSAGGNADVKLTTGCAWAITSSSASWLRLVGAASGAGNATFNLVVDPYFPPPNPPFGKRTATVTIGGQILTVTQAGMEGDAPFGVVDTPADNVSGVTGSLPVTGWALDDVSVTRVRIFRDAVTGEPAGQVYLGDATFVDGARPDVQAVFPSLPFASRAGWGYLLLTNMLPGGGTGTYRLSAYADDIEGRTTRLGSRTITCTNRTATTPFGTIDTPGQGETVSGTITNWGWALTPRPAAIQADGSTIDVLIDGAVVGHPIYGVNRSDVAALFPGYANMSAAGGYFTIDTTTFANGVHTIAWIIRDSAGKTAAVGSRYFTVVNP